MPPASTKSASFQRMVGHGEKAGDGIWYVLVDRDGWGCGISPRSTVPTFEEYVQGWMAIPTSTPSHRDENGVWKYDVKWFSRSEAEAKVRACIRPTPADWIP